MNTCPKTIRHGLAAGLLLLLAAQAALAVPLRERSAERLAGSQPESQSQPQPSLPPGARVLRGLAYGDDRQQRMDVYLPPHAGRAPLLLMVHGGGWYRGDKEQRAVVEHKLARWLPRGFIFISIDYRLVPRADPLQQADDVARALAAAQRLAPSWGGDPERLILLGHSAGAHLATLLTADPARALAQGARPWLGTVALDSAAIDLVSLMRESHLALYDRAFGADPEYWRRASPLQRLTPAALPLLLVCSTRRQDDSCRPARQFAARAGALGRVAGVSPQDLSHRQINLELGLPGAYTGVVERFMATLDPVVAGALADTADAR